MHTFTLNTGKKIPAIGFGTWEIKSDDTSKQMVLAALEAGYRIIDTARIYGNEKGVGAAIRESGIAREDIFVSTKLWNDDQGYNRTIRACETSLEKLGLDYLDLYLIHWPATSKRHDSWAAFEELYNNGVIKAAGVSNYAVEHLKELQKRSTFKPAVNQVEFHPFIYEQQQAVLKYCAEQDIQLEAYSPISRLGSASKGLIHDIAERLGKSPQQVVLRWCVQHDALPLPRSTNPDHAASNLKIFDFSLTDADMKHLNSISDGERVTWDPAGMG